MTSLQAAVSELRGNLLEITEDLTPIGLMSALRIKHRLSDLQCFVLADRVSQMLRDGYLHMKRSGKQCTFDSTGWLDFFTLQKFEDQKLLLLSYFEMFYPSFKFPYNSTTIADIYTKGSKIARVPKRIAISENTEIRRGLVATLEIYQQTCLVWFE